MEEISKIDKIKNLAVFSDYRWDTKLDPFKRYNLIYGWNGSGKTALSRLFDSLESGEHEDYPDLEFQVAAEGKKYTQENTFTTKVRVFNSDYIQRNVNLVDGHASPIYVLGEKSKEILDEIQQDEISLNGTPGDESDPGKIELRRRADQEREQLQREVNGDFTNIARTISAAWGAAGAMRTYRRPNAHSRFDELTEKQLLSEEDIEAYFLTLSQAVEPELDFFIIPDIQSDSKLVNIETAATDLVEQSKKTLGTEVQKVAVERLAENQDISDWVEEGLKIHATHDSKDCEFCQQLLPSKRLDELNAHFSEADKQLKQQIDSLNQKTAAISSAIDSVTPYDHSKLYKQFEASYKDKATALNSAKETITESVESLAAALAEKKNKTTEAQTTDCDLDIGSFSKSISDINDVLTMHNDLTINHEVKQESARRKIEDHHLSTISDGIEQKEQQISNLKSEVKQLNEGNSEIEGDLGIEALKDRIAENQGKVSSVHKSCDQLNERLRKFFGRDEISFAVKKDAKGDTIGYEILRSGKPAKNISEGERTAIAFAYFCIHLTDQNFTIKDGIVVLDDPISSLDSGLLFKVCAAIKKLMQSAGQLVILTHNFEFFNHLKKWFVNDPQICGHGDEPVIKYRLLMVQNGFDEEGKHRTARLVELDPMLRDYESEYHYLFKKLASFDEDNPSGEPQTIEAIYDYPTIARKLLECFLSFRVPTKGSFYVRMLGLRKISKETSSEDIEFVYNFVNSHSHLDTKTGLVQFDPTLTITGPDAIKLTLKLIEQADAPHYKAMCKAIEKN